MTLPPATSGDDTGEPAHDAGKKDGAIDASPPAASAPATGEACKKADQIFSRPCGACGTQEALCEVDDAGAGTVSVYSACHDELAGGCVPGASVEESCGNCGTHTKTCSKYCAWSITSCKGEPADSCPAGEMTWSVAGCSAGGTVRARACSATCSWGTYSSCAAPDFKVAVAAATGAVTTAIVPLEAAIQSKRVTGSCGGTTTLSSEPHNVAWVTVTNATAQNAVVSIWTDVAPGGGVVDTSLVSYASMPGSDADLQACEKGVGEYCDTSLCSDGSFGSLVGTQAVAIDAGASKVIGVFATQTRNTGPTDGPILFSVRTEATP